MGPVTAVFIMLLGNTLYKLYSTLICGTVEHFGGCVTIFMTTVIYPIIGANVFVLKYELFFDPSSLLAVLAAFINVGFFVRLTVGLILDPAVIHLLGVGGVWGGRQRVVALSGAMGWLCFRRTIGARYRGSARVA